MARQLIMDAAEYISRAIVTLIHLVDPSIVVLGGAMNFGGEETKTGAEFISRIREQVSPEVFPTLHQKFEIRFARLAGDAGWIGAAGIAKAAYDRMPSAG